MKALVTGGGGFLGLYITEQLVACGHDVRVFSRGSYPRLDQLGVESVRGDIRDVEAVISACRGIETVFHAAAITGVWGPWKQFFETNTRGTEHVIAGCHAHGVAELIYTSSPSVVFDGSQHCNADETLPYPSSYLCHYPRSKAMAERAVLDADGCGGLSTCSLRPHLIWGPRDNQLVPHLIRLAKSDKLRRVGDGENLISMSYVENAAHAHLQAADALSPDSPVAGQAYFINEPQPVKLWEWIDHWLQLAGLPPVQRSISAKSARMAGATLEAIYRLLRLPGEPPITRFLASQLSSSHYYSVDKARREFGFQPQVSIEEGMRRTTEELRQLATS